MPFALDWRWPTVPALMAGLAALTITTVVRADPPSLPPGEKLLFQPGLPAGWRGIPSPARMAAEAPSQVTTERFVPENPWQADWEELLAVTIFLGQRLDPASALELERKPKSQHKTSRCQAVPQMMYSDTEAANGYPAATDVVFCPDDGNGKAYLSIGKFIAGTVNYYALHRTWTFPATSSIPVPTDEQRRWVNIMTGAIVCDNQAASSPCKIRPGISYMAITPRQVAATSPATEHIMAALAKSHSAASAQLGDQSPTLPQPGPVQATSLYGVPLSQATRTSLRRAIQGSGLMKAIKLDLIDSVDSYTPIPSTADARQLDVHYAPDGRFSQAEYLFKPDVGIDKLGERMKSRFGPPAATAGDTLRWMPAPTLTIELRQGAGGAVLAYKRD
ncbi:hypothetical protein AB4Z48_11730 [Cupriavidus sp. 2TAF22]|uniref:hypothetical protein n=1 Tax=unclassified Cupriavidus TaxID=2640874 RepID=UPI003F933143